MWQARSLQILRQKCVFEKVFADFAGTLRKRRENLKMKNTRLRKCSKVLTAFGNRSTVHLYTNLKKLYHTHQIEKRNSRNFSSRPGRGSASSMATNTRHRLATQIDTCQGWRTHVIACALAESVFFFRFYLFFFLISRLSLCFYCQFFAICSFRASSMAQLVCYSVKTSNVDSNEF